MLNLRRCLLALLASATPLFAHAATARLQAGTHITLQLAHHISSSQTPAGTPVWFRVKEDVKSGEDIVVRKGALVRGQMSAVGQRGAIGASGNMNFGVRFVPAVDGQNIRVIASTGSAGRDRSNALLGWTLMWGVFGLFTKGVDAYALRGSEMDAEVLSDKVVEIPAVEATVEATDIPSAPDGGVALSSHLVGTQRGKPVPLEFERFKQGTITFSLPGTEGGRRKAGPVVTAARIVAINGVAPPEAIESTSLEFGLWQLLQHCDDGANALQFEITADGGKLLAHYELPVKFIQRKKK